jgi:hypothetical protein
MNNNNFLEISSLVSSHHKRRFILSFVLAKGYLKPPKCARNRVIRKVRQSGAENSQFQQIGHQTRNWEWKFYKMKEVGSKQLVFPPILVVNWVSFCVSFFLSACTAATYNFTAPTCTTTIITLEHWKRGYGLKQRVTLQITLLW